MADLWSTPPERRAPEPLARRMCPGSLDDVLGQEQILGPGKLLRSMLDADRLTSAVLRGPPGTGKTALAEVIAAHTGAEVQGLGQSHLERPGRCS